MVTNKLLVFIIICYTLFMNKIKWLLILFFAFIIVVKLYLTIKQHITLDNHSIVLLLSLGFILIYKCKFTWFFGIAIYLYGIYIFLFISTIEAVPSTMEFTSSLNQLLYGDQTGFSLEGIINIIPAMLYLFAFILFLTKKVRQQYHVTR